MRSAAFFMEQGRFSFTFGIFFDKLYFLYLEKAS